VYLLNRREFIGSCFLAAFAGKLSAFFPAAGSKKAGGGGESAVSGFSPSYRKLHDTGKLRDLGNKLWKGMRQCKLCPRECRVDRLSGEKGFCGADFRLIVSSAHPHFGEEAPLVGRNGSGTVFFSHCSLRCVFCINWQISHRGDGSEINIEELASMMLKLQERGCHNINVVTPTHYLPHIILALDKAAGEGLDLPLVYNTCGWERIEILKMLDGIVDIYLPDFKYFDSEMAAKYSTGAGEYPEITRTALLEMNRQVGTAREDDDGLIRRGLMIRHLVMPNNTGGSSRIMQWIAENLPKDTYVNIMSQYRPVYRADEYPAISRRIYRSEYEEVIKAAKEAGLTNLEIQGMY
jgi:putative pyruvate formate lyase activating enzyme